ncbi:YdeI/OmpD-associated family protein [Algibacter mikhailovii]|uniref:YdhG-like domain-containing protein n=1 Tax=Algibacter mikhailovii TaxID=425498 RepID=A0A918V934_9FLAO|nr:DUF1801 domain-containing protein [Algibacter mikhailovii]GGZ80791.1 hypothetical protein GCM10007028_17680 [Algibacter mikhailovii]
MKKVNSVEEYIELHENFSDALTLLRAVILKTELKEHIKWGAPEYSINNKNVISLGAFKNHLAICFFNGVFLTDPYNLIKNIEEGKTKAMRQIRFNSIEDINTNIINTYILEAIQNQKLNKEIKPDRTKKQVVIPSELQTMLNSDKTLNNCFESLSNSKQREYCEYIMTAKRESTKQNRISKIIPLISASKGLYDKYKNC